MASRTALKGLLTTILGKDLNKKDIDSPGRRPGTRSESGNFVLMKPFWIEAGRFDRVDWSERSNGSCIRPQSCPYKPFRANRYFRLNGERFTSAR